MTLPNGRRGQATALGLLIVVIIIVAEFFVSPLIDRYLEIDDDIFAMRRDAQRYTLLLGEREPLSALITQIERENPLSPITLHGENTALAAAELQQIMQQSAARNDVRLLSLRIVNPDAAEVSMEQVIVEARALAQVGNLRGMLFELETGSPYVFLRAISIRTQGTRKRQQNNDNLDVRMELYGFRFPVSAISGGDS